MKYKKLLISVTWGLFIVIVIIAFIFVFRVSDVNVDLTSNESTREYNLECVNNAFGNYNNKNLIFINKKQVEKDIVSTNPYLKIEKIEKVIPNYLNIKVKERIENYSLKYNNSFYTLDNELFVVNNVQTNKNNLDDNPNVEILLTSENFEISSLSVGSYLNIFDSNTSLLLKDISSFALTNRKYISKIDITVKDGIYYRYSLCIFLTEGVKYNISSYNISIQDKLDFMFNHYLNLMDKSNGEYYIDMNDNGEILIVKK